MSDYDNNLTGVLFKNDDKREGKRDPDYKGNAEIDGRQYWLSAWINESKKDGRKFMSLRFKEKEPRADAAPADKAAPPADDFNDEIPFAFAILAPFAGLMAAATYAAKDLL